MAGKSRYLKKKASKSSTSMPSSPPSTPTQTPPPPTPVSPILPGCGEGSPEASSGQSLDSLVDLCLEPKTNTPLDDECDPIEGSSPDTTFQKKSDHPIENPQNSGGEKSPETSLADSSEIPRLPVVQVQKTLDPDAESFMAMFTPGGLQRALKATGLDPRSRFQCLGDLMRDESTPPAIKLSIEQMMWERELEVARAAQILRKVRVVRESGGVTTEVEGSMVGLGQEMSEAAKAMKELVDSQIPQLENTLLEEE